MLNHERTELTRILLRSRLDYLPSVRTSTGQLQRSAVPGPAASGRKPCETCRMRGRVFVERGRPIPCRICPTLGGGPRPVVKPAAHGCRACPTCLGAGWLRSQEAFDEYLGTRIGSEQGRSEERFFLNRDIARLTYEIDRLEAQAAEREGDDATATAKWRHPRDRHDERGSYAELDRLLEQLRARFPNRHRLVWAAEVLQLHPDFLTLSDHPREELDHTVRWIAAQMPDPIKVPGHLLPDEGAKKHSLAFGRTQGHERQRGERNAEIRRLADTQGLTSGQIARHIGLTKRRVQQILAVATAVGP